MKKTLVTALALAIAGCGGGPSGSAAPRATPRAEPASIVAQVRAVGATGHELDEQPLRDPQVQDLRERAQQLEARGEFRDAGALVDQALAISVDDPDLLQWKAELALHRAAWAEAESFALRSYARGPKLGGLCRRNWATVQHARAHRGDAAGAAGAKAKIDACTVAPPVRM